MLGTLEYQYKNEIGQLKKEYGQILVKRTAFLIANLEEVAHLPCGHPLRIEGLKGIRAIVKPM
jgi:hypothetical protein